MYPVRSRLFWYAGAMRPEGLGDPPVGRKRDLLDIFDGWPEGVPEVIGATPEEIIDRQDVYDRDPVDHWSDRRVTLLGDAAHPTMPSLGQGAGMAIEDGAVIGRELSAADALDADGAVEGALEAIRGGADTADGGDRHALAEDVAGQQLGSARRRSPCARRCNRRCRRASGSGCGSTRARTSYDGNASAGPALPRHRHAFSDPDPHQVVPGVSVEAVRGDLLRSTRRWEDDDLRREPTTPIEGVLTAPSTSFSVTPVIQAVVGKNSVIVLRRAAPYRGPRAAHARPSGRPRPALWRGHGARLRGGGPTWPLGEPLKLLPRLERITLGVITGAIFGPGAVPPSMI